MYFVISLSLSLFLSCRHSLVWNARNTLSIKLSSRSTGCALIRKPTPVVIVENLFLVGSTYKDTKKSLTIHPCSGILGVFHVKMMLVDSTPCKNLWSIAVDFTSKVSTSLSKSFRIHALVLISSPSIYYIAPQEKPQHGKGALAQKHKQSRKCDDGKLQLLSFKTTQTCAGRKCNIQLKYHLFITVSNKKRIKRSSSDIGK